MNTDRIFNEGFKFITSLTRYRETFEYFCSRRLLDLLSFKTERGYGRVHRDRRSELSDRQFLAEDSSKAQHVDLPLSRYWSTCRKIYTSLKWNNKPQLTIPKNTSTYLIIRNRCLDKLSIPDSPFHLTAYKNLFFLSVLWRILHDPHLHVLGEENYIRRSHLHREELETDLDRPSAFC